MTEPIGHGATAHVSGTHPPGRGTLLILPPLHAMPGEGGRLILPRKFVDGTREWARRWEGPMMVALEVKAAPDVNPDHIAVHPNELPFQIRVLPQAPTALAPLVRAADVVLSTLIPRHTGLAELCAGAGTPLVYDVDYTHRIRVGIVRAETRNPLRRWRRLYWQRGVETRYRKAIAHAGGLQCNGRAAFQEYGPLSPRAMCYVNSRVRGDTLATAKERAARQRRLLAREPLRLVFSGRWTRIKGVLDLPRVAAALRERDIAFTLDIYGRGELEDALAQEVRRRGLDGSVHLHGELPFPQLLRTVAGTADLFVCCHPQGDPSTTFIETMSCGVPLVGYDRDGLHGVLGMAGGGGWLTPAGDTEALAARIAQLDAERPELVAAAETAFDFARQHTFERTIERRAAHLRACADARGQSRE